VQQPAQGGRGEALVERSLHHRVQLRQRRAIMDFAQRGQRLTLFLVPRRSPATSVRERIGRAGRVLPAQEVPK